MRRPIGVTIVAGLIILLAVLGLLGVIFVAVHRPAISPHMAALLAQDPVPASTRREVGFLAGAVEIVSAVLILRGWEMGRTIYAVIGAITIVLAFATSPLKGLLVINLIVFGVFLFVLYHPVSTRWFKRADAWPLP